MNRKWLLGIGLITAIAIVALFSFDQSPLSNKKTIHSMSFLKVYNPSLKEDIIITVSGDSLRGVVPYGAAIDALIPEINYTGSRIHYHNKELISGTTKANFSNPGSIKVESGNGNEKEYFIDIKYFTGLPQLYLFTDGKLQSASRVSYITGRFLLENNPTTPRVFKEVKIRGRGNTSWGFPKRSIQLKFDKKEALCGMPADKRWLLLANYTDKSLLRNELAYDLGRISNLDWTPESRFVELIIDNQHYGNYQLTQKVEESKNRVNIGDEGFLLEAERSEKVRPSDVLFETKRLKLSIKEPKVVVNDQKYTFIKKQINDIEEVLFSKDFADPINGYAKYMDVPSFVDWYLISEISRNNDAIFHSSVYMHIKPEGKLTMGPIWDYDIAFGNINYRGNEQTEGFYIKDQSAWIKRLFEDPKFVAEVKNRMKFFSQNKEYLVGQIYFKAENLKYSQEANFKLWPILGKYIWPNSVYFKTYEEEVNFLSSWLNERMTWLEKAIEAL